jgi:hypothetical protein
MEDLKSGTPTYKLKTPSKPITLILTEFPSPLTENTLPPEEKIENYTSGILKTLTLTLENSMLDLLSSKLPLTLNYNGLPLEPNKESKSGT